LPTRSANHPQSLLLNSEQALNLFRITQEAVQNAIKHAHADQISVRLETSTAGPLHLSVEDDGVGFVTQAGHPGHYGLLNMQLRAERLGGQWQVSSIPGRGTALFLSLPLKNTEIYV
jgi:signal transduction histidine kinase